MKILRINHLGLVPKDNSQALYFFNKILGLGHKGSEVLQEQKVSVDFIACPENSDPEGGPRLEILQATDSKSPIALFLAQKGSGIQHLALEVDHLEEWLAYLKQNGILLVDQEPRVGAHETRIAFVHPRATGGILVELVQEQKEQGKSKTP